MKVILLYVSVGAIFSLARSQGSFDEAKCAACGAIFQELSFVTNAEGENSKKQDPELRLLRLLHESGPDGKGICEQMREYVVVGTADGRSNVQRAGDGKGNLVITGHVTLGGESRDDDRRALMNFCDALVEEYEDSVIDEFLKANIPVVELAEEVCVRRRAHCTPSGFRALENFRGNGGDATRASGTKAPPKQKKRKKMKKG